MMTARPSADWLGKRAFCLAPWLALLIELRCSAWNSVVGELIVRGSEVAVLKACALEDDVLLFVAQPLRVVADVTRSCGLYREDVGLVAWSAKEPHHALAWRLRPDGTFFVVCR